MISKLLKRLGIFILPIMVGVVVIEYSLRSIPNDYSYKNSYLKTHSRHIEVLILGNSHFYRGIIPEDIDLKSFNAAYISQTPDLDYLIFNAFKNDLKNLKILVIGISYPSLFSSLETSKESWRVKNYNLYYDLNVSFNPKNYSEFLSNTFDINRKRFLTYYKKNISSITTSTLGGGAFNDVRDLKTTGIKAAKRHTKKNFPYYKEYTKELHNIINWTDSKNIKVMFITTPAYKTYTENLDNNQLKLMNNLIDSLTHSNLNVSRLNLMNSDLFGKEDFNDADHLNIKGARKMTELLNIKIDSLQYSIN